MKYLLRLLLRRLYRVHIDGLEHLQQAGARVLIVANHVSFLDPVLLWAFLPDDITFAINTQIAQRWWIRPSLRWVKTFSMDTTNPHALRALAHYLQEDRKAVIFPEGRITVTGALMKIYDGAALVADRTDTPVIPLRIDGPQYTPFSRMQGKYRLSWFPAVRITLMPAINIKPEGHHTGHIRRHLAGLILADAMRSMMFTTARLPASVFDALLEARQIHGGKRIVLEDVQGKTVDYNRLITQTRVLANHWRKRDQPGEAVGLLLPTAPTTVACLLALQQAGCIPALLNFSSGIASLQTCCTASGLQRIITSRRFIELAKLEPVIAALAAHHAIDYLEDLAPAIGLPQKLAAALQSLLARPRYGAAVDAGCSTAVMLFTSGSEGQPKGVALSHANLLANRAQLAASLDFGPGDRVMNALPLFHSFGLTAGTLLPLLAGMRTLLYPSPLHYRIIPEMVYETSATILFGTNTFLAAYGKQAHPYDFFATRYVFAGAEKLQASTRALWQEKFGIRLLEGYGATETSPVIAVNTPMHYRSGTVGRLLPGMHARLEPISGIRSGGKLWVQGPNVMQGYLLASEPGRIQPLSVGHDGHWYDTGDIAHIDDDGFITLLGRVKRFAKVAGEMVSLTSVEELAARTWPEYQHAVIARHSPQRGEDILLLTNHPLPLREALRERARLEGLAEIMLPRELLHLAHLPLLASGKVDYPSLEARFCPPQ